MCIEDKYYSKNVSRPLSLNIKKNGVVFIHYAIACLTIESEFPLKKIRNNAIEVQVAYELYA